MRPPQYARFDVAPISKRRLRRELAIVLALSFGYASVQSIITILRRLTQETALASQTATIYRPLAGQPLFDLAYQLRLHRGTRTRRARGVPALAQCRPAPRTPRPRPVPRQETPVVTGRHWLGVVLTATIGIPGLAF